MADYETVYTVAADHPALPGHFPENPLVPGVMILDAVQQALEDWLDELPITEVHGAKFVSPLRAEQPMRIMLERKGERKVSFRCQAGERLVAQGSLSLQDRE